MCDKKFGQGNLPKHEYYTKPGSSKASTTVHGREKEADPA